MAIFVNNSDQYTLELTAAEPKTAGQYSLSSSTNAYDYSTYRRSLPICTIATLQLPSEGEFILQNDFSKTCNYFEVMDGTAMVQFTLQPNQRLTIANQINAPDNNFLTSLTTPSDDRSHFTENSPSVYINGSHQQELWLLLQQTNASQSKVSFTTALDPSKAGH